jgi:hypothetical protein
MEMSTLSTLAEKTHLLFTVVAFKPEKVIN